MSELLVTQFAGLRNDVGELSASPDYLRKAININYDNINGADCILMPKEITNELIENSSIDGISNYKFLSTDNVLISENVAVAGGKVFRNWESIPVEIYTGLTPGAKCSFAILNDQLFITNGIDFPLVYNGNLGLVKQMGAPFADVTSLSGGLLGQYYYAMTYVTTGGEEVVGTISNIAIASNNQIELTLPIGYDGTTSRKIYRTIANGSELRLLTTIADNTTLTFLDNTPDINLGIQITNTNNEIPKPFYIESYQRRLIGAKITDLPTQIFVGETNLELWDRTIFSDISNIANDNTKITALGQNFNRLIVISEKNIFTTDIDSSGNTRVQTTNALVGALPDIGGDGIADIPDNADFRGGLMFPSSLKDIRVFNGKIGDNDSNELDNLRTENFSQVIRGTLEDELSSAKSIFGEFFQYKYHLIVDNNIYIYDIRTNSWANYNIISDSFRPTYNYMSVIDGVLYMGRKDSAIIEQAYVNVQYKGEDVDKIIETHNCLVTEGFKYLDKLHLYISSIGSIEGNLKIILDDDYDNAISIDIKEDSPVFSGNYYSSLYYFASTSSETFKTAYITRSARWMRFKLTITKGAPFIRAWKINYSDLTNKEVA